MTQKIDTSRFEKWAVGKPPMLALLARAIAANADEIVTAMKWLANGELSPLEWKRHLQAFQKRLTRAFGKIPAIWKLEPQRRGAPHNHLILLMPETMCVGLVIVGPVGSCRTSGNG